MKRTVKLLSIAAFLLITLISYAEDGHKLWLRYERITDNQLMESYTPWLKHVSIGDGDQKFQAIKNEVELAASGLLNIRPAFSPDIPEDGGLIIGTPQTIHLKKFKSIRDKLDLLGPEGYIIRKLSLGHKEYILIAGNTPVGALYGTFHFFRLLQMHTDISNPDISESPKVETRILNHWDNLDRTVERGYSGFSIWDWHKLPDYIDPRYTDYARANASIGINGTVLNNVNANSFILTRQYLEKVAALAAVFRPYGIKVYLTARFSSPMEIGGLTTADPLAPEVQQWWKDKAKEIYTLIPDFGGFLVKANSEGQPGPQNYKRTHADGANMLADALAPFNGKVMWRAFVYTQKDGEDRAKQANIEFEPLDGQFRDNVLLQVKNGPIDFQPSEPFHPLFGSMPKSQLALELQITQEYLGQGTHLVYLAPLYKECLESDTYAKGKGSSVAKIVDGSLYPYKHTVIAGVSNIGTDRNWTGHQFGQANWYAFGRLCWNHELSAEEIADEWIRQTFSTKENVVQTIKDIMLPSRETCVSYMTPMGLHHIMAKGHHYGPGPWVNDGRADWTSVYYHKADSSGIGFDRTKSGSYALSQYAPKIEKQYSDLETCPEKFLLWFHHLDWDYKTHSGQTLWNALVYHYYNGAAHAEKMESAWKTLSKDIDNERFLQVEAFLKIQSNEAKWWRNACVLYFQTFSKRPIPGELEKPDKPLEYYESLRFPYAPGIKPNW
jgi:alpha-glucuronidase